MSPESPETAGPAAGCQTPDGMAAGKNGAACQSASSPSTSERSRVERAEHIVDHMSESVTGFASRCSRGVGRLFSFFKEGCESIWDEAQHIRRGDQPTPPQSNPPSESGAPKE
jgi:hypothetical protein